MLVTQQSVFKRFWYPVIPQQHLVAGPQSFILLDVTLVAWLDEAGQPVASRDCCSHPTTRCAERYGYIWVCLEEPLIEMPDISEAGADDYRLIQTFYEPWQCSGLRAVESELNAVHSMFANTQTFFGRRHPTQDELEIVETDWGASIYATLGIMNERLPQENVQQRKLPVLRLLEMTWFMPFAVKLKTIYPDNLVHIVVRILTPISDCRSQMVQFCLCNDTESERPASDIVAASRAVALERKCLLESLDSDVLTDPSREEGLFPERPSVMMRKKVAALLKSHGETEEARTCCEPLIRT